MRSCIDLARSGSGARASLRPAPAAAAAATTAPLCARPRAAPAHCSSSPRPGSSSAPAPAPAAPRRPRAGAAAPAAVAAAAAAADTDDAVSEPFAVAMAKVADDTKVQDLVVLNVAPLVSWTSYFVICTVISKPQLLAVMARVEKAAEEEWGRSKQNSPGSSPWEVLDYGDVVVHVFTPDQREHYDLESYYSMAEEVDLPFVTPNPAGSGSGDAGAGAGGAAAGGASWTTTEL
ncbi:hypothetical protein Rsub_08370 [Raphidocelis subcapitata]|uniref:Uncharacterized protein n=1 Tax=Raphidocelis subcapitata TaxID=307507 RepID=A0A2V0P6C2_9CHLO|nr:hypothetical protein Rsub_08370 [Raphidocelis subcapitata]|eukprot:GBF95408.1 hypothetical protein Rsub_08370 [Raphidocelis subcapitata]